MKIRNINKVLNAANSAAGHQFLIYYNLKKNALEFVEYEAYKCIELLNRKEEIENNNYYTLDQYLQNVHYVTEEEVKIAKENEENGIRIYTELTCCIDRNNLSRNDIYNLCDINNIESYAEAVKAGVPVADILA